ncbi:MAG: hypothetical protein QN141_08670 [Armatimonadota bacterium]|nr:hypothetical protein [Armatimonadota bacterium]MDR7452733.1 hypothetical protein [Armatimonadota bacterium]MDR7467618.1 hypothetical protein [Armatimonadota bacterium]MDR7494421.1 hypothetical protein [Armatimonadota bacterium]MDR7505033.1 hypothetical protein [Armatimonadota bacterium]
MDLRVAGRVLPDLRVVSRAQVALHEDADPLRVAGLAERLRRDGMLRNPPVAALLGEDGYVVLDGANRVSALARLDLPAVPLQVVNYDDPAVRLEVWRHLILDPMDLPRALREAGVPLEAASREAAAKALRDRQAACYLLTNAHAFVVPLSPQHRLADLLRRVVAAYKGAARIYRVPTEDFDTLVRSYGEISAVVVFPQLDKQDIVAIAASPAKLPTGITRHLIPGRALRVNIPLDLLAEGKEIDRANARLQELVRARLLDGRVRYYPEGAFLFDE